MPKRFEKVYIEISNVCNFQCEFCPEVIREKKFMDLEFFTQIITQVAPLTEQVCLHLMGEPLVHPQLGDFIKVCGEHMVPVNLTSNGALLNEKRMDFLLSPIVFQVNFSLHSFEANFPEKNVDSYIDKIFDFTRRALMERPDLYVNFRLWNIKNSHTLTTMTEKILKRIQTEFQFTLQAVDVRWKKSQRIKNRLFLHFDSRFEWPHPQNPKRTETGFCHGLGSHIGILADGRVVPCCLDKEGVVTLGNCHQSSVSDIVTGERARKIHEGFQNFKLVEDLCQRCTFIKRFDKKVRRC